MIGFTASHVPDQSGKTILITGGNSGLGFETAKTLAGKNARVLIACRSLAKAAAAKQQIVAEFDYAEVEIIELNLANLESIRNAAEVINQQASIDVLIHNAGIMVPPLERTDDGFESQFGVNHLGPFALNCLLLDKVRATPHSRIISTSSVAHKSGRIMFDDIPAEQNYNAFARYAQSKIANLYFAYELQRRLSAAGDDTISVAVHPGGADTELMRYLPNALKLVTPLISRFLNTAESGSWPTLCGATMQGVQGGEYYGPSKRRELAGPAIKVRSNRRSHDQDIAKRLWDLSIEMTGVDPQI